MPATLKEAAVSVFLGIQNYDYYRLIGIAGHAEEMDAYFGTGNSHSCAVGRLSFFLGGVFGWAVTCRPAMSFGFVSSMLEVLGPLPDNLGVPGSAAIYIRRQCWHNGCAALSTRCWQGTAATTAGQSDHGER